MKMQMKKCYAIRRIIFLGGIELFMKKAVMVCISVIMVLALVIGCSQKKTTNQEGDNQDVEANAQAEGSASEEDTSQEGEEETVTVADITDKQQLVDFVIAEYSLNMDKSILEKDFEVLNYDIDGDSSEEAICYSPNRDGFYGVAFVKVVDGKFELMKSDLEQMTVYTHKVEVTSNKFIHYIVTGGGTGCETKVDFIYIYDGEKIKNTSARLVLSGRESQLPTESFPDGYQTDTIGTTTFDEEGNYTSFVHQEVQTGSNEYELKEKYVFNEEINDFEIEVLVDTENGINNEEVVECYDPADMKVGDKIGPMTLKEIEYEKGQQLYMIFEGSVSATGTLSGYRDEMYGEDVFEFKPDEKILDRPIRWTFNSGYTCSIDDFDGMISNSDILSKELKSDIMKGNTQKVKVTIKQVFGNYMDESEGGYSITLEKCEKAN